jgi:hypothetical protein
LRKILNFSNKKFGGSVSEVYSIKLGKAVEWRLFSPFFGKSFVLLIFIQKFADFQSGFDKLIKEARGERVRPSKFK